jgi:hypothetical protein
MIRLQREEAVFILLWIGLFIVVICAVEKHVIASRKIEPHLGPVTLRPVSSGSALDLPGELDTPGAFAASQRSHP